jgi:hypothetical protein
MSWTWRDRLAALPRVGWRFDWNWGTNVSRFYVARWSADDGPKEWPRHSRILWLRSQRSARDEPLLDERNIVVSPTGRLISRWNRRITHRLRPSTFRTVEASDHKRLAKRQKCEGHQTEALLARIRDKLVMIPQVNATLKKLRHEGVWRNLVV